MTTATKTTAYKTLYQVTYTTHSRSAKTKASIAGVSPAMWASRNVDILAVLASSEWEAGRKLAAEIMPGDNRPLACLSYLRQYAVRSLKVGQEVATPDHGQWFEEIGNRQLRTGKWNRGVVAEVLGDDPATALVGVHMYREVYRDGERTREWYTGPHGEKIVVDFPVRQLAKAKG